VENHVCLARAANTGISAFIDGAGRFLWTSEINVPEAHALELAWLPGGSLYTKSATSSPGPVSSSPAWRSSWAAGGVNSFPLRLSLVTERGWVPARRRNLRHASADMSLQ